MCEGVSFFWCRIFRVSKRQSQDVLDVQKFSKEPRYCLLVRCLQWMGDQESRPNRSGLHIPQQCNEWVIKTVGRIDLAFISFFVLSCVLCCKLLCAAWFGFPLAVASPFLV